MAVGALPLIQQVRDYWEQLPQDALGRQHLEAIQIQLQEMPPSEEIANALDDIARIFERLRDPYYGRPQRLIAPDEEEDVVAQQARILEQIAAARAPAREVRVVAGPPTNDLCARIYQAVAKALEDFVNWVFSFIASIFAKAEPQLPPTSQTERVAEIEQPADPIVNPRRVCNDLLIRLWDHLRGDRAGEPMEPLIEAALASDAEEFPRIEEWALPPYVEEGYENQIRALLVDARRGGLGMNAAIVTKEEEAHLILIDARGQGFRCYHFNPNTRRLLVVENLPRHLEEIAPAPYQLQPLMVGGGL